MSPVNYAWVLTAADSGNPLANYAYFDSNKTTTILPNTPPAIVVTTSTLTIPNVYLTTGDQTTSGRQYINGDNIYLNLQVTNGGDYSTYFGTTSLNTFGLANQNNVGFIGGTSIIPLIPTPQPGDQWVYYIGVQVPSLTLDLIGNIRGHANNPVGQPVLIFNFVAPGPVPCFFGNAPVRTPSGNKRIDSLVNGDIIVSSKGDAPIKNLRSYSVPASQTTNPYLIPKGIHGASQDLLISPLHAVVVDGKLVAAKDLGLVQQNLTGTLTYFNIELDKWDNMFVADVEVETLAPAAWVAILDRAE